MCVRIVVTGGRDYDDETTVAIVLSWFAREGLRVAHGDCPTGADALVKAWCRVNGTTVAAYPAAWTTHGRAAGPLRNERMLTEERPDLVIAFPGGRGTGDCVTRAVAKNIPVLRIPRST